MTEPRAPYWIRRLTDGRIIAEAADYEAAREAMWLAWQRGWMVEVVRNPLAEPEEGAEVEACA